MPDAPSELDRLVLGPDAAFAAAKAPAAEPRPPRTPARRKGPRETALTGDLKEMPAALRKSALAVTALGLARTLDDGGMSARDEATMAGQFRQYMVTLIEMAPGERKNDSTDQLRERRERRLAASELHRNTRPPAVCWCIHHHTNRRQT